MRRILTASLRGHARRFVAGALAIVLGVGFVSGVLIALDSARTGLERSIAAQYENADLVVTGVWDSAIPPKLAAIDGVAATAVLGSTSSAVTYPDGRSEGFTQIAVVPDDEALRWHQPSEGRLPQAANEIVMRASAAEEKKVSVGDTVTFARPTTGDDDESARRMPMKVVGLIGKVSLAESATFFANEQTVAAWNPGGMVGEVLVRLDDGADASAVRSDLLAAAGSDAEVRTGTEEVQAVLTELSGGIDIFGGMLLGFTAIAMFVAMLVVANTFNIVVAQRARELALFRCVGAAKRQVFASVLGEALIVGLAASAVGILVGLGLANAASSALQSYVPEELPLDAVTVTPGAVIVPILVGTVTTMVAALAPARRATRVPPLAALHPEVGLVVRSRAGAFRLVSGGLLILAGAGAIVLAMGGAGGPGGMLLGVSGGVVSFLGVLLFSPILAPAVVRLLGLTIRRTGVPGQVAADNAVRNPRRTAATAAALMVGVTLISLLTVGAATSQATYRATLDQQFPMDLAVSGGRFTGDLPSLPANTPGVVRDVEGITETATVRGVRAKISAPGETPLDVTASGVDPAAATRTLHHPRPVAGLEPGTAVISPSLRRDLGIAEGGTVRITVGEKTRQVKTVTVRDENTPSLVLAAQDLAALAPKAPIVAVWARIAEDADIRGLTDDLSAALRSVPDLEIEGAAPMRSLYDTIVDGILLVATALLAMSVVIALVGVSNTLGLSVLERTRENALLRALGLTRGQLRATLALEATLIAGAAVLIGLGLGIVYGYVGTSTLFAGVDVIGRTTLTIPWERLGLVVAVALSAGVLASVLPARRAVKVPPSAALSSE